MMQDESRQPMQVDGTANEQAARSPGETSGRDERSGGESGGGAYPNPHSGREEKGDADGFDGGQSERDYHGGGTAGDDTADPAAG